MNVTKRILVSLLSIVMLLCVFPIGVFANVSGANNTSDGAIVSDVFNNHEYKVYDLGYTWEEANEFCNRLGGHLVTITSKEEQQFIENLIKNGTKNNYWLGGKRNEKGTFCLVTSEPISYTNWAASQPDNSAKRENCMMMYRVPDIWSSRNLPGKWNDVIETGEVSNNPYFGSENFGFICEWENTQKTEAKNNTIEIGDYITLGTYLGEPIVWRCVDIDENGPLMLAEDVICSKEYDAAGKDSIYHTDGWGYVRKERGSNCWYDSNIRQWLNSNEKTVAYTHCSPSYSNEAGFLTNFSEKDLNCIKTATRLVNVNIWESKRAGYCDGGSKDTVYSSLFKPSFDAKSYYYKNITDTVFLLSAVQINNIYNENPEYLKSSSEYWTCSTYGNNYACYELITTIDANGSLHSTSNQRWVSDKTIGIRPAFYLNLENYDDSYDTTKKVVIYDREFDKNIDYYTANCSSSEYNPTLANMLAALSAAAYDETKIVEAYESLGFTWDDSLTYDYDLFDPHRSGYAIATKESEYNDIICLITIRGTYLGNCTQAISDLMGDFDIRVDDDGKHKGFAYPAYNIYNHIESIFLGQTEIDDVKFVITGHSRGGAVGNLLAVELMEEGISANNIYNYNFACPDVACLKSTPVSYNNIFNLCNTEDPIPYLPGEPCNTFTNDDGAWWVKYGQTYRFTHEDEKIEPFSNHAMDLYLEFLNQSLDYSKFPYSPSSDLALWFAKILCPVDVIITDEEGREVAAVINGEVIYYDSSFEKLILVFTDGDKKVVYINEDANFNIDLIGTDDGTMKFILGKYDLATGELSESKTFNDVVLEEGKTMYCSVDETTEINNVSLFVVEEKDGEMVCTHTIETDGTETPIKTDPSDDSDEDTFDKSDNTPIKAIIIIGASILGIVLLVAICIIAKKKRS